MYMDMIVILRLSIFVAMYFLIFNSFFLTKQEA